MHFVLCLQLTKQQVVSFIMFFAQIVHSSKNDETMVDKDDMAKHVKKDDLHVKCAVQDSIIMGQIWWMLKMLHGRRW